MSAPDAAAIVKTLGGRWRGRHGMCRCPAHDDRSPSLSVTSTTAGVVLVHCFSGCPQAEVIGALQARGLWPSGSETTNFAPRPSHGSPRDDERKRGEWARTLWDRATPASDTLVVDYLRSRSIRSRPPTALRFIARLEHKPSDTCWPAMIAAVTDGSGAVCAVQRTWLALGGRGKAPVTPSRMTAGPMRDGAVKLCEPAETLGLAEGVETALSARQAYSLPVWAVLGCNRFEAVVIPSHVRQVVIFGDRGDAGWKAAEAAADRFERESREVEIVLPPSQAAHDFNDWIREGAAP